MINATNTGNLGSKEQFFQLMWAALFWGEGVRIAPQVGSHVAVSLKEFLEGDRFIQIQNKTKKIDLYEEKPVIPQWYLGFPTSPLTNISVYEHHKPGCKCFGFRTRLGG